MPDLTGQIINNRYRIDAFIGRGGMAEVYKVWDKMRSVYLAMKILYPDLAEDKIFIRRFKREAQTLAKMHHPNIVRFYGLEKDIDIVYILMDYVEGTTLRKEIFRANRPFSTEQVIEIIQPICAALHYAHQSGFVHCDIKPANIMINTNGTVLLTDFGIARLTDSSTVTMVGSGTPAYMAPEQVQEKDPVPQTDIYALGVIIYEMFTGGERPFIGEHAQTSGSTSEKVRWEQVHIPPPSPKTYNSSLSNELESIILLCLKKNPIERYKNCLELVNALMVANTNERQKILIKQAPLEEQSNNEITHPPGPGQQNRYTSYLYQIRRSLHSDWVRKTVLAIGTLLIIFFIALKLLAQNIPVQVRYFTSNRGGKSEIYMLIDENVLRVTQTNDPAKSWSPAVSFDGILYFTSNRTGKAEIYMLVDDKVSRVTQTSGDAESWEPVVSPDGTLYFTSDRTGKAEIYMLVDDQVSRVTQTSGGAESWAPVVSTDGILYFTSDRTGKAEIYMLVNDKVSRVTQTSDPAKSWSPAVSSDGILYFTSNRTGKAEIYMLVDDKVSRVTQTNGTAESWAPAVSSDGILYFTSDRTGKAEIHMLIDDKVLRVTRTDGSAESWMRLKKP